ncbi:hypothetical protein PLESTB_000676200 [Pleodorina starrii]|uniref:Uncharacterized protein n=1 Tax=Pleodorina starrii TaxID=330485 RepID=A0A9W6F1J9_9CHLO|nr:hypothetical protein PLESTB_000676200 [Pleodorina starrii]
MVDNPVDDVSITGHVLMPGASDQYDGLRVTVTDPAASTMFTWANGAASMRQAAIALGGLTVHNLDLLRRSCEGHIRGMFDMEGTHVVGFRRN